MAIDDRMMQRGIWRRARRAKRERRRWVALEAPSPLGAHQRWMDVLGDDDIWESIVDHLDLQRALATLPRRTEIIVYWHGGRGVPLCRIARHLHRSSTRVGMLYRQGLEQLRRAMAGVSGHG